MQVGNSLRAGIDKLRTKYAGTSFVARLDQADTLDTVDAASAFYMRDTDEATNVVWLAGGIIYDATWFPASALSTLIVLPVGEVIAFEAREAPDVVRQLFESVGGDVLIRAFAGNSGATLYWAASFGAEAETLRQFFEEVLRAYASARKNAT